MNIKHFLQVLIPHLYVLATFLPSVLPLQNFNPQGYQPIQSSKEHVQGTHKLDVSAHLDTNCDLVSVGFCCAAGVDVKLYTAAINDVSVEPNDTIKFIPCK